MTWAPRSARLRATAAPIPEVPPCKNRQRNSRKRKCILFTVIMITLECMVRSDLFHAPPNHCFARNNATSHGTVFKIGYRKGTESTPLNMTSAIKGSGILTDQMPSSEDVRWDVKSNPHRCIKKTRYVSLPRRPASDRAASFLPHFMKSTVL